MLTGLLQHSMQCTAKIEELKIPEPNYPLHTVLSGMLIDPPPPRPQLYDFKQKYIKITRITIHQMTDDSPRKKDKSRQNHVFGEKKRPPLGNYHFFTLSMLACRCGMTSLLSHRFLFAKTTHLTLQPECD